MRISGAITAALVTLTAASGCSAPPAVTACPAIAHSTVVPVEISGSRASSVVAVKLCSDEEGCSNGVPVQPPQQPTATLPPPPPPPPDTFATPAPQQSQPTELFSQFITSRISEEKWEVQTSMVQPAEVTAQALDASGTILAITQAPLEWTRIGGSEECGGPSRSTPVRLDTNQ